MQGISKEKQYKVAYNEAIRESMRSFNGMNYSYSGKNEKNEAITVSYKNDVKKLDPSSAKKVIEAEKEMADIPVKKEATVELDGPTSLISEIIRMGEKGISLQRYKGLGEMNADQLWETTLDPEARTLLRVKVDRDRTTEADDLFTCLMGEVVEPRKNFIQEHALSVKNLDF